MISKVCTIVRMCLEVIGRSDNGSSGLEDDGGAGRQLDSLKMISYKSMINEVRLIGRICLRVVGRSENISPKREDENRICMWDHGNPFTINAPTAYGWVALGYRSLSMRSCMMEINESASKVKAVQLE